MSEEKKAVTPEQVEKALEDTLIQKYQDEAESKDGLLPNQDEFLVYLEQRYRDVKNEYKLLVMQKREVEATKNEQGKARLPQLFEQNYKQRKWVVGELKKLGKKTGDPVFPD